MKFKTIPEEKFKNIKNNFIKEENNFIKEENNFIKEENSIVNKKTIFIHPACFNEDEIYNTINTAYEQASNPDRVYFGLYNPTVLGVKYLDGPT